MDIKQLKKSLFDEFQRYRTFVDTAKRYGIPKLKAKKLLEDTLIELKRNTTHPIHKRRINSLKHDYDVMWGHLPYY